MSQVTKTLLEMSELRNCAFRVMTALSLHRFEEILADLSPVAEKKKGSLLNVTAPALWWAVTP